MTVVTRRIPQRFFRQNEEGFLNPLAGTVVDNTLTKMEFADFYLISQSVNQVWNDDSNDSKNIQIYYDFNNCNTAEAAYSKLKGGKESCLQKEKFTIIGIEK